MHAHTKHEIVACERCRSPFECKANSFTKCQCMTVQLNINETQYISEQYDGCLCAACLTVLRDEYRAEMSFSGNSQ
ncbi:cysteine-rich CWC family protein [Mucilaginibacter jinjuensis]|uniref:Cysteine-rich CWC family protein n=1 Tax=Mucilaginibacter jinjuensis TaxID=1176721 RepID=A0ABY7TBP4_9SPHI|nr:cysteine-rich CWC family protein [Mucilaginibacter jinjuensis]WCT13077.1 cysteine-rich CWC family protein [Mucilaginibacter jinjuensis]